MRQTAWQIFIRFLKFGLLAWGGPVAQIAMIKKELVDDEEWVSKEEFNRALALYQVLPGPEAHELCVYFGMKARGRIGGLLAGLGFMLPGFLLMLLCTWAYIRFGIKSPAIQYLFIGIQAAVISLIVFAVYRIGKHAVINNTLLTISIASAFGFFVGVHFLIILVIAGLSYSCWQKQQKKAVALLIAVFAGLIFFQIYNKKSGITSTEQVNLVQASPSKGSEARVLLTGFKAGMLTFGGAYTAIPFVQQDAVEKNKWLTQEQFLDGIAVSGILPAPLVIFTTFVGYFGAGWIGALLITLGVFLPAFTFTLIGHAAMEKLMSYKLLHNFLDGVTAAVVGLIGITAIELFVSTITGILPFIIFTGALIASIKFRSKYAVIFIILLSGLSSLIFHYLN